ncbi:uncharacterized protein LOC134743387 [Cydia strobilella]|uniref:uncharacterized protein LOC134743387 n=1 Tax=Cydia strobilella TaxID=1100964 RepID=UPI003004E91A
MSGQNSKSLPQEVPILCDTTERASARAVVSCCPPYSGGAHRSRTKTDDHGKRLLDNDACGLVLRLRGGGDEEGAKAAATTPSPNPPTMEFRPVRDNQGRYIHHAVPGSEDGEEEAPVAPQEFVRSPTPIPTRVFCGRRARGALERLSPGREEFFSPAKVDTRDLPSEKFFRSPLQTDADTETADSDGSLPIPPSNQSGEGRKRLLSEDNGSEVSSDDASDPGARRSFGSNKRGRGHPTTAHGVGLARAKAQFLKRNQEELKLQAAKEVAEATRKAMSKRLTRLPQSPRTPSGDEGEDARSALALTQQVLDGLGVINHVATKSKNLKGTFVRDLKQAMVTIREAVTELGGRSVSDETEKLAAENTRLKADIAELRKEMGELRASLAELRAGTDGQGQSSLRGSPTPLPSAPSDPSVWDIESIARSVTIQVSQIINARFDGLEKEGRLLPAQRLGPPLAGDKTKDTDPNMTQKPSTSGAPDAPKKGPPNYTQEPQKSSGKGKAKGKKSVAVAPQTQKTLARELNLAAPLPQPTPPDPVQVKNKWQVAGRNKKKGKKDKPVNTQPQQSRQKAQRPKKAKKLTPPRSSAVVLTLLPEAKELGVTYANVLSEAKKVDLTSIGITKMRIKRAVTGGQVLEVPGTASDEKADQLAKALAEKLGEQNVRISRPIKCAELRLSELDDSVSPESVAAAIAINGGCPTEKVKTGEIRRGIRTLGTLWVRCPVTAAKKVVQDGRLDLGWGLSARVSLLKERPMRCFRCLQMGHTSAQCTATEDHSALCFRCGQPGHKRAACSGPPSCVLCSAAGKPADHKMGSKACKNPRSKKDMRAGDGSPSHAALPATGLVAEDEIESLAQWGIHVAVLAEPYSVSLRDDWAADLDGTVAIVSRVGAGSSAFEGVLKGKGFVSARCGCATFVGIYFSPNRCRAEFERYLTEVGAHVAQLSGPLIVAGDFNAKSTAWGSPVTDVRGEVLEEWAVATGLTLANTGAIHTCVRQQGGSIVDLTFTNASLAGRVNGWKVMADVETLSDHRYIRYDVFTSPSGSVPSRDPPAGSGGRPRWALSKLDRDRLTEAATVQAWLPAPEGEVVVEAEASWFREAMTQICDAAMPRAKSPSQKTQVYWWTAELALLRKGCSDARRRYQRQRRRRRPDEEAERTLYALYKAAKESLKTAMGRAMDAAREEFLETLNADPWGRPYKLVRNKLRPWAPPLTQTLEIEFLEEVVTVLFPARGNVNPPAMAPPRAEETEEVPAVSAEELRAAVRRMRIKNTAPGPDGLPGRAWALAIAELEPRLTRLFSACLDQGRFPVAWKTGKLVLLKKEGRPAESPSAYRPIVLLDEVGKLFERIIASRLIKHMQTAGPDLADNQFGFRSGHSTVDAILCVKTLAQESVSRGEVVLAVSLDIRNAFNTMPWETINEAMRYHCVPPHLARIIRAYLSDRFVEWPGQRTWGRKQMECGVPQGSVLGPLLWNVGYDWVLRGENQRGISVFCYADDTLVMAKGPSYRDAAILATAGVAQVVSRIRRLGLEVALQKSEAICFYGPRKAPPMDAQITVGGVPIAVKPTLRYLGVVLDSKWNFKAHFERLAPKLISAAAALGRLLKNLGGPKASCRRLYTGVVRSIALYGAPVWADAIGRQCTAHLRRSQRAMALRTVRGYRTVSTDAACVLAGSLPWDLEAKVLAELYFWRVAAWERDHWPTPSEIEARRADFLNDAMGAWECRLERPIAGSRTIEAIRPVLKDWVERRHGVLTFRLTQILSGHGCFGRFLWKIVGREPTPECHECGAEQDTAQHTLEVCPAWGSQRSVLIPVVGSDLSLPAVIAAMVRQDTAWQAMLSFCEEVVAQKEKNEREREIAAEADSTRRRRVGRRRAAHDRNLPP